jgi:AcrR family transcriptional regulator
MGRPPRYDVDTLLDCAVRLVAEHGPTACTVAGVAAAAGAPSGSVYHRFSGRPALLAALWLRTTRRFQHGFFNAMSQPEPLDAALDAAMHTLTWSRHNPVQARLLLHGRHEFAYADWPSEDREQAAADQSRLAAALRDMTRRLPHDGADGLDRLTFAIIDVPLALVRRRLTGTGRMLDGDENLVATTVLALLG